MTALLKFSLVIWKCVRKEPPLLLQVQCLGEGMMLGSLCLNPTILARRVVCVPFCFRLWPRAFPCGQGGYTHPQGKNTLSLMGRRTRYWSCFAECKRSLSAFVSLCHGQCGAHGCGRGWGERGKRIIWKGGFAVWPCRVSFSKAF